MKNHLLLVLLCIVSLNSLAQKNNTWKFIERKNINSTSKIIATEYSENQKLLEFDPLKFRQLVSAAVDKNSKNAGVEILLPNINGDLEKFLVWESSNFEPTLQAKYPEIRAFKGKGITDPTASINFSFSPKGIKTMVFRNGNVSEYIEPYTKDNSVYVLFDTKTRIHKNSEFSCLTPNHEETFTMNKTAPMNKLNNQTFRTLRVALSCTGEYGQYFGGKEGAIAAMNATMSRVNGIYENDLSLHFIMVNNDAVVYDDPNTDPYDAPSSEATQGVWNAQLQNTLDTRIGNNNYNIGHLFAIRAGNANILGNAGFLAGVCVNGQKGSGFSSADVPQGDTFDVGTVAHEMGHQLGANHIFSYKYESYGACVEPGTGSSIMGYPGTGTGYDVQSYTDAYFNYISILQIENNLVGKCAAPLTITNTPPTVDAGADFVIPGGTAYILKGSASDDEGDSLTYCWEQNDSSLPTQINEKSEASPTKTDGPNYRSFLPTTSPNRYMPALTDVLVNQLTSKWESVSTVQRTLNFVLTVRDNHFDEEAVQPEGLTASDKIIVSSLPIYKDINGTVINPSGAGPFKVTSQGSVLNNPKWNENEIKTITWDVNNTNNTAIIPGAEMVNIRLSIDAGQTFPYILAANTPNDGNEEIIVPETPASLNCRILVEPTNSIFYAVNFRKFAISDGFLATEDFEFSNFSLYPNPSRGSFTVQFDNPSANDITVNAFDLSGRKIFENNFSNQATFNEAIHLNNVVQGIYLISIQSGNQRTVKRIMIE